MSNRRHFIRSMTVGAAGLALPVFSRRAMADQVHRDPYTATGIRRGRPIRLAGRVTAGGRAAPGVCVSDGLSVVRTGNDGRYLLESDALRTHVFVQVPTGHRIPVSSTGTARFWQPIDSGHVGEQRADFSLEPSEQDDTRHTALFLADPQTQDADEMRWFHEQTVPDVRATASDRGGEVFGATVGDLMFDDLTMFPDYERAVKAMGLPFFQVVGNHDLEYSARTSEAATATFTRHFGPRWYSFDRGAVHYVVLDDVFWHGAGYLGYLGLDQLTWLAADLQHVEAGRTVIVMAHIPIQGSQYLREGLRSPGASGAVMNREALYRLLEPYRAHLITGHMHECEHLFAHGVHEHVVGAVCGAWWSGPICGDGTPSGYAIYDINGDDVRWTYKSTGLAENHQLRVTGAGSDPAAPQEIVANVWNADDQWQVAWYENGVRRGLMARRTGLDPESIRLHTGPDLPARRKWVEPYRTAHLYYAPASPGTDVLVEATDRFGRTFTGKPVV